MLTSAEAKLRLPPKAERMTTQEVDVAFSAVEHVMVHGDLRGQEAWTEALKALNAAEAQEGL